MFEGHWKKWFVGYEDLLPETGKKHPMQPAKK